ncbi:hypothetical protein NE237_024095 [Protea cynaroides]|uniref:Uncharacterized protein n=1 Tax=Protea cynaroides TaxID=273540 RepID=A0A9Q0K5U2_9MAGN|nr:hypothetical protein NE237_024095 [Protea cynaroides]
MAMAIVMVLVVLQLLPANGQNPPLCNPIEKSPSPPKEKSLGHIFLVHGAGQGQCAAGFTIAVAMENFPQKIHAGVFVAAYMPDTEHKMNYVLEQEAEYPTNWLDTYIRTTGNTTWYFIGWIPERKTQAATTSLCDAANDSSCKVVRSPISDIRGMSCNAVRWPHVDVGGKVEWGSREPECADRCCMEDVAGGRDIVASESGMALLMGGLEPAFIDGDEEFAS